MNSELYFEGKKFISAKRASEITGYTSDYIGQLCRGNKLECRQVGRGWFVSENSITSHKKIASEKTRGTIAFPPTILHSLEPLPKEVLKARPHVEISLSDLLAPALKQVALYVFPILLVASMFFLINFARNGNAPLQVARVSERVISLHQSAISNTASRVTKYVALVDKSVGDSPMQKTAYLTERLLGSFGKLFNRLALATYRSISALFNFGSENIFVIRDGKHLDGVVPTGESVAESLDHDRIGIAVTPSSGDAATDEKTKQKIKNSFSDETRIIPDRTGQSGVIQPVFKKSKDQDYLYVVVPIDE